MLEAHGTKTGERHEVPLTPAMRAVLTAQPKTTSALVFPSSRGAVQMSGWTKLVGSANRASGVMFKLHDLRRTARTLMSRLGVRKKRRNSHRACPARVGRDLQQGQRVGSPRVCVRARVCAYRAARVWRSE